MRRLIGDETAAPSAVWTRRLAVGGGVTALVAVLMAHRTAARPEVGLALMVVALALAGLALVCAMKAAGSIWRTGRKGTGRVLAGMLIAGATLAYPGYVAVAALGAPLVSQATTDVVDPPRFSRAAKAFAVRGDPDWLGQETASSAEPLTPLVLDLDAADTFAIVKKAVSSLRWRLIEAIAPEGRLRLGRIDATTASPVMRLPQDITIRIRPLAGQTRVDIRSASRLGFYDFGESVETISQLTDAVQAQLDAQ